MHHIGTITKSSKFPTLPFHAQCTCGPAGDFSAKESAAAYLQAHFAKLGGVATSELIDHSDKPEVNPLLPLPHVGGVGTLPASHAVPPPAPPPPPNAGEVETGEQLEHDGPATEVPVSQESAPVEGETNWKKKKK